MKEYVLIMKGNAKAWKAFSAEEKQRLMEKYNGFVNRLKREDRFTGGNALNHAGFELRNENGLISVDGPFPETKEVFNGYMGFKAENIDEAVKIARECPALTHGEIVEIFEVTKH